MPALVDQLRDRVHNQVREGHTPACQVSLRIGGEPLLAETVRTEAADGVPPADADAGPSARFLGFSIAKGFLAVTVAQLVADGRIDLDRPVAHTIPEFGTRGLDMVTARHLLTHTSGFADAPMRPTEGADRQARRARFATWRLDHEPGAAYRYHATSASWVLATLVEEVAGTPLAEVMANELVQPLGLQATSLGDDGDERVVDVQAVGDPIPDDQVEALARQGIDVLGPAETAMDFLLAYNEPEVRAAAVPGAGIVTTAADVTRLYSALLDDTVPGLGSSGRDDLVDRVVVDLVDPILGVAANRTLGFVVAGDDGHAALRGFGEATSPRAFGQPGVGGQVAWADPETGVAFCFLTAGLDRNPVETWQRVHELSTLAARCAG